jgi:AI-2 transport protein TqsA
VDGNDEPAGGAWRPRLQNPAVLRVAAYTVVTLAGAWWLLGQLAGVLRPLLLAVLLSYVLLPYYSRLRRNRVPAPVALVVLAGAAAGFLVLLALAVSGSLLELSGQVEPLRDRAVGLVRAGTAFVTEYVPWLQPPPAPGRPPDEAMADLAAGLAQSAARAAGSGALEAATAGLYLLFLLLGAEKLPEKVRAAYPPGEAEAILHAAGRINSAIISYLKAKVKSSLALAVPAGVLLAAFDVRFALLWGVLTFLCNFIPYAGSVIAYTLPVGFAFLQLGWGTAPVLVAVLLLGLHVASATLVEPLLLGKAVGLSPLVILAALAVWGSLWGLPGMFLAVPLTAVVKLALENIELTRPWTKLAED